MVTALCTWGGCLFASSSTDKTIRIWDTRVTEAVRVFDPLTKPGSIFFVMYGFGEQQGSTKHITVLIPFHISHVFIKEAVKLLPIPNLNLFLEL